MRGSGRFNEEGPNSPALTLPMIMTAGVTGSGTRRPFRFLVRSKRLYFAEIKTVSAESDRCPRRGDFRFWRPLFSIDPFVGLNKRSFYSPFIRLFAADGASDFRKQTGIGETFLAIGAARRPTKNAYGRLSRLETNR